MKTLLCPALVAALAFVLPITAAAQAQRENLQLTMQDGRVTIIAQEVPLRQILAEWARVGQTKIVNGEKLSGPAVTLQLVNKTEREALDILLRTAAGYMAAARPAGTTGVSAYDRITILASSRAPAASAGPLLQQQQPFQRPPVPVPVDEDDEPVNVNVPPQMPQQPPVISPFPGATGGQPNVMPTGANPASALEGYQQRFQPGMMPNQQIGQPSMQPMTSPRPGVLPPQPIQPGGVQNPYQQPQPTVVRPGGPGGPEGEGGE
jgi:hypothetical protein